MSPVGSWHASAERLARYAAGRLTAAEAASIEAHLLACSVCRVAATELLPVSTTERMWQGLLGTLDARRRPRLVLPRVAGGRRRIVAVVFAAAGVVAVVAVVHAGPAARGSVGAAPEPSRLGVADVGPAAGGRPPAVVPPRVERLSALHCADCVPGALTSADHLQVGHPNRADPGDFLQQPSPAPEPLGGKASLLLDL